MKKTFIALLCLCISVFSGCENQTSSPSEQKIEVQKRVDMPSVMTEADLVSYGKQLSDIFNKAEADPEFSKLQSVEEKFNYIVDLENKKNKDAINIKYSDIKAIAKDIKSIQDDISESNARIDGTQTVPTLAYGDYLQNFSNGERDFINYATSQLNTTTDLQSFGTKVTALKQGLRNQTYTFINYNTDRIRMLENFLTLTTGHVSQWSENLDTFNPYNTTPNPFRANSNNANLQDDNDSSLRVAASCRGWKKKLCIAIITAALASAAGSVSFGGATLAGAAAGYILARCCICCSCNVVCSEL